MKKLYESIIHEVPTPCYVVFEERLRRNLEILSRLQTEFDAKVLLAQKCFSMYYFYPMISQYLTGTTASGLNEAKLAAEHFGGENHVFAPAYRAGEIEQLATICDHVVFNSFRQLEKYASIVKAHGHDVGLRINPEYSTQLNDIYDPCSPTSRLGTRFDEFDAAIWDHPELIDLIDGVHMHTLCEQNSDALDSTVRVLENKLWAWLGRLKWINLGGGHLITRRWYNIDRLKRIIARLRSKYEVEVYLEPGEAVALDAGILVASVLEIQPPRDGVSNVILDTSAACHMPDVLEMPYRPNVVGAARRHHVLYHNYRFCGETCLAGDVIGEYSFEHPLREGDRIVFEDMAIYTMVKNNTFNGLNLPTIAAVDANNKIEILHSFGYNDFKERLS